MKRQGALLEGLSKRVEQQQKPLKQQQQRQPQNQSHQHRQQQQTDPGSTQDPPHSEDNVNWETVKNKRMNKRRKDLTRSRPDAIIIKAGNMSYADMLKRIKTSSEIKEVGETINGITKTKDGHLRIVLSRETKEIENLKQLLKTQSATRPAAQGFPIPL